MVTQGKISEGIGLPDALPDKMIAKILLYPVLSVLIWSLFNSQNLSIGGFYEGWGSRFQLWINFSYKFQIPCHDTRFGSFRILGISSRYQIRT